MVNCRHCHTHKQINNLEDTEELLLTPHATMASIQSDDDDDNEEKSSSTTASATNLVPLDRDNSGVPYPDNCITNLAVISAVARLYLSWREVNRKVYRQV